MSKHFKLKPGPKPRQRLNDDDNIYGPGWHAVRISDGFYLRWDSGDFAGKSVEVAISSSEFQRLRNEPEAFYEIANANDPDQ